MHRSRAAAGRGRARGLSAPLAQRGGAPIRGVYVAYAPYDPKEDRYTLYADVQYPHRVTNALASSIFKVPWGDLGSTTLVELAWPVRKLLFRSVLLVWPEVQFELRFVQWVGRVTLRAGLGARNDSDKFLTNVGR